MAKKIEMSGGIEQREGESDIAHALRVRPHAWALRGLNHRGERIYACIYCRRIEATSAREMPLATCDHFGETR